MEFKSVYIISVQKTKIKMGIGKNGMKGIEDK